MNPTKITAVQVLRPNKEWVWRGDDYSGFEWLSEESEKPTEAEILAKLSELEAEWYNLEYQRKRAEAYPDINKLIVALWEKIMENKDLPAEELQAAREIVKQLYPKP